MDREINILTFEALVPPVLRSTLAIRSKQGCGGRILEVGGEGFRSLIDPAETIKGAELIEARPTHSDIDNGAGRIFRIELATGDAGSPFGKKMFCPSFISTPEKKMARMRAWMRLEHNTLEITSIQWICHDNRPNFAVVNDP
jgi:hypothetical protein